jgi:hypothetical protein
MSVCNALPSIPALRDELALYLIRAYEQAGRPSALDALNRCHFVLDTLAVTTMEYALFRNRLHNAQRYSIQAERGAARFELRLLLHSLAAIG